MFEISIPDNVPLPYLQNFINIVPHLSKIYFCSIFYANLLCQIYYLIGNTIETTITNLYEHLWNNSEYIIGEINSIMSTQNFFT